MVSYTLPGMTEFPDLNLLFLSFYRDARDIFFDDVAIESVYGGFPGSPLCGGRNNLGEAISLGDVEKCLARYRNLGVACNVTFTNQLATSAAIERDAYGKRILSLLDEQSPDGDLPNGVILYTDAMDEYVRSTHPRLRRISSTTKQLPSVEATSHEIGEFDRVVLNYNLTHDEQAISSIDHPEKLEVMANEYCTLGCPYRTEHYRATSESQIKGVPCAFECKHKPAPQAWGFLNGLIEGDVFLKKRPNPPLRERSQRGQLQNCGSGAFPLRCDRLIPVLPGEARALVRGSRLPHPSKLPLTSLSMRCHSRSPDCT